MKNRALPVLTTLAACLVLSTPAHALTGLGLLPAALSSAIRVPAAAPCGTISPATGSIAAAANPFAKTSALLGGAPSQLELIARQQAGGSAASFAAGAMPAIGALSGSRGCAPAAEFAAARPAMAATAPGIASVLPARPASPDDFLSSRRLSISRTSFDAQWSRVSHAGLSARLAGGLARLPGQTSKLARIEAVNAWANGRIRYVEDAALYRQEDYWADARTTLRNRAGDCEDIAILKMQLLIAAGIPREAMYLTIARDLARRADHALLVVRDGDRHWLLDNATNTLVDANSAPDYRPIFSFGEKGKWLHGY